MPSVTLVSPRGGTLDVFELGALEHHLRQGFTPQSGTAADARETFTGRPGEPRALESADLLAHAEIKANSASITATEGAGGTDVTGLSVTVDSDGTPLYLSIDGFAAVVGPAGVTYGVVRILEGATEVQRQILTSPAAGTHYVPAGKRVRITPTAGEHTYKVNCFVINCTSLLLAGSDTATTKMAFNLDVSRAPLA